MASSREPSWALLLRALYEGERSSLQASPASGQTIGRSDGIHQRIGLDSDAVDEAAKYLIATGLLERDTDRGQPEQYELTRRGFDVAHQRAIQRSQTKKEDKRSNRQSRINATVALVTYGLLIIGFFELLVTVYTTIGVSDWQLVVAFALAAVLIIRIVLEVHQQGNIFTESVISEGINTPLSNGFTDANYNDPDREQTDHQGENIKKESEES